MERDKAYYPALVKAIKVATSVYHHLGTGRYVREVHKKPGLIAGLEAVLDHQAKLITYDIRESRAREHKKCSLCRVPLVNPAYIIGVDNGKEVSTSAPIGIKCLHYTKGKLEKLLKEDEMKEMVMALEGLSKDDPELAEHIEVLYDFKYAS